MTSEEAKTFERIAPLALDDAIIPKSFKGDYDWLSMSLLQDIGLVKTGDFTVNANKVNDTNSSKDTLSFIYCYGKCTDYSVYSLRGDGYKDYDENSDKYMNLGIFN